MAAVEFVREEPLKGVLRRRIAAALQAKPDGRPPAPDSPSSPSAPPSSSRSRSSPVTADLSPEQETGFERLRARRGATAKEQGVPAYVVFHDATLRAIAVTAPSTLSALAGVDGVDGVGESKLAKYGESILGLPAS